MEAGHSVTIDAQAAKAGQNIIQSIAESISKSDAIIVILSKSSLFENKIRKDIQSIIFSNISKRKKRVVPLVIDDVPIPAYLLDYLYVDGRQDLNSAVDEIVGGLSKIDLRSEDVDTVAVRRQFDTELSQQIEAMGRSLHSGRLTLICGAGISVGAGIPDWNSLLRYMFVLMIDALSKNEPLKLKGISAESLQNNLSSSALVIGKYLKTNLGKDFLPSLRDALYSNNPKSGEIINEIVSLARPQRNGRPLDSIITFNFDGLLEENFLQREIQHKTIYAEGTKSAPNEIPIYHVHGYLPRTGRIPNNVEIVLSEDAYHSQFIDPFSWSNLIILNKLGHNTCLLIGISLSDPNMRRLLDVSNRKNPEKTRNHFLIKKRITQKNSDVDSLADFLDEQDANNLGINLIWIDQFDNIPEILRRIRGYAESI